MQMRNRFSGPVAPRSPRPQRAMKNVSLPADPPPNAAAFAVYVAAVLTVAMALFPPFTSLSGTEYAFVLSGPEWSRAMGALGTDLGLSAHIHWALLLVQLAAVWALALGVRHFLGPPPGPP